jgi:predicted dehydrogenase
MQGGRMLRIATIGTSMITDDFIQVVNANDQMFDIVAYVNQSPLSF